MSRSFAIGIFIVIALADRVSAQTPPWQFRWQKGQVLHYRVEHATQVVEVASAAKTETSSKLAVIKRWEVTDVDPKGHATLRLSLTSMRHEQTRPNGEVLVFDSLNLDKSTPELRDMTKHIGQTVALIVVDHQGRVVEVKQGAASQYDSDPPFVVVFPNAAPEANQAWDRVYQITLDPPHGTGEKYAASQRVHCTKIADGKATLSLTSQIKTMPDGAFDRIPLLQKQPQGEITFDIQAGRLHFARLVIDKTLEGHQGEGSSYRFLSTYSEQFLGGR